MSELNKGKTIRTIAELEKIPIEEMTPEERTIFIGSHPMKPASDTKSEDPSKDAGVSSEEKSGDEGPVIGPAKDIKPNVSADKISNEVLIAMIKDRNLTAEVLETVTEAEIKAEIAVRGAILTEDAGTRELLGQFMHRVANKIQGKE